MIVYQERLRVHHIEESDGETIEARELVHMAEDSDDKDEAQVQPIAGGPSVDPWMAPIARPSVDVGPSMDNLDPPLAPNTSEASSNKRYNWICLASASRFHLLHSYYYYYSFKQAIGFVRSEHSATPQKIAY